MLKKTNKKETNQHNSMQSVNKCDVQDPQYARDPSPAGDKRTWKEYSFTVVLFCSSNKKHQFEITLGHHP